MKNKAKIVLICIFLVSFYLAYQPHAKYPLPLHVDEWFHIAQAKKIAENNLIPISFDVYTGEERGYFEILWHYPLAVFIFLFNPNIFVWQFLPSIMAVFAVLSVYFFAKRWGEKTALIAAFFVALLPSNVTFGGTVFLVPINLSLIMIPLALHFAFDTNLMELKNSLSLFALIVFLLLAHPPSAVVLLVVLGIYLLLNLKENFVKAKRIFLISLIAVLVSLPNYLPAIFTKGANALVFPFWVHLESLPIIWGIIPSVLFVVGSYWFLKEGKIEEKTLVLASIFLLMDIVFFQQTDFTLLLPYQRALLPLMLFMSIIAANVLAKFKKIPLIAVIGLLFIGGIGQAISTPYYHVIEKQNLPDLEWIKENTPKNAIVLADPWIARAVTPIAERKVYTVMPFGPNPRTEEKNQKARDFLQNECKDTNFLKENKITIIYNTIGKCNNPQLTKTKENIYIINSS